MSWLKSFWESYPNARGFVRAYLPGYSEDANQALVRAGVGPSAHGAMLTALMEKQGEKCRFCVEYRYRHSSRSFASSIGSLP